MFSDFFLKINKKLTTFENSFKFDFWRGKQEKKQEMNELILCGFFSLTEVIKSGESSTNDKSYYDGVSNVNSFN